MSHSVVFVHSSSYTWALTTEQTRTSHLVWVRLWNSSTWEVEAAGSRSSRSVWSIQGAAREGWDGPLNPTRQTIHMVFYLRNIWAQVLCWIYHLFVCLPENMLDPFFSMVSLPFLQHTKGVQWRSSQSSKPSAHPFIRNPNKMVH